MNNDSSCRDMLHVAARKVLCRAANDPSIFKLTDKAPTSRHFQPGEGRSIAAYYFGQVVLYWISAHPC